MNDSPLHNRSTFWYIVISISVGLAVLYLDRRLNPVPAKPPSVVLEPPNARATENSTIKQPNEPTQRDADKNVDVGTIVKVEDRDEIWRLVQAWSSSFQSGDVERFKDFYSEHITRFYNHANVPAAEAVQNWLTLGHKYSTRTISISNPVFRKIGEHEVEVNYDKEYYFAGSGVPLNQGKVQATLRLTDRGNGGWKITSEFDREICWSTLMHDPFMRTPPGTCPVNGQIP